MSSNEVPPFENNWAYLKAELRWLDRMLMMAVARKRQDDKTLRRVANTAADRATSHWWKGIISVNRGIDDREGPPPKTQPKTTTVSYNQQLQARIQACQKAGIVLALPLLRDCLKLSQVEKNIVLMAIAPEVNRRYGRLYDFLQEEEGALDDLPTVDLCLRLLCRNDDDWQQARARLTADNSLANRGLLEWIGDEDGTLLSQQVKVSEGLASFLLAEQPTKQDLEALLTGDFAEPETAIATAEPFPPLPARSLTPDLPDELIEKDADTPITQITEAVAPQWENLVLPKKLIHQLQYIGRQAAARGNDTPLPGLMVLLVGKRGTGKTLAAATLAHQVRQSLTCIELETLSPEQYPTSLTNSPAEDSSLLLIKQGEQWFGRRSQVEQNWLYQWWHWRKQFGLTLVTVDSEEKIRPIWRHQFDVVLTFPLPDVKARQEMWERAFAPDIKTHKIDWLQIAQQLPLTGGDIAAIAQTIQLDLRAKKRATLTISALREAVNLYHPQFKIKLTPKPGDAPRSR